MNDFISLKGEKISNIDVQTDAYKNLLNLIIIPIRSVKQSLLFIYIFLTVLQNT